MTGRVKLWFVVAPDSPALAKGAIRRLEHSTGLPVFAFPKEREFFVELKLPLTACALPAHGHAA